MLNLPMRKKCTLTNDEILGKLVHTLKSSGKSLIKDFQRCICDDIKNDLDEQKVENFYYTWPYKSTLNTNRSSGSTKKSFPEVE